MTHILNMKQGLHPQNYAWSPMLFTASPRQFPEFKTTSSNNAISRQNFSTKPSVYETTLTMEKSQDCDKSLAAAAAEPISQYCQILSGCRKKKKRRRRRNKKKNKNNAPKHQTGEITETDDESCRRNSVEVIIGTAPRLRERSISTASDDSFIICFEGDSSSETAVPRGRQPKISNASDDSFIICFDGDSSSEAGVPWGRQRQISTASDDSFICFEGAVSTLNFDDTEVDESALSSDDENTEDLDSCESLVPNKKVRFAEDLCHVHPMIKWSFAYQSARKGPWEECARDRDRFNRRIRETEQKLAPIFNCEHRTKVFNQRFVDGAGSEI